MSNRLPVFAVTVWGLAMLLSARCVALAADISSDNGNANTDDWNLTSTWSPAQVPGASDNAHIGNAGNSGNVVVTDTESVTLINIAFQNNHSLTLQGAGDLSVSNGIYMSNNGVTSVMNQTGGVLHLTVNGATIYDGYIGSGTATYSQSGGSISGVNNRLYVGYLGNGIFNQSGGTNTGGLFGIGGATGRTGVFNLTGGTLNPVQNFIGTLVSGGGTGGTGTLNQSGGSYAPGNLTIGDNSGATGTYNLMTGGSFTMNSAQNLIIGNAGSGTWNIGDALGTPTITQGTAGGLGIYTVRANAGASGTIHGWGNVPFSGNNFINNGRIIADGFGTAGRTLDLSAPSKVGNTIENVIANGSTTNGYFAVNQGKLILPAITNITANTRNWGEADSGSIQQDATIDLVNSAQVTFGGTITNGGAGTGKLAISLLTNDPTATPGLNPVGTWEFVKQGGLDFSSLDLTFRYDDVLAGGHASALKMYYSTTPGTWIEIPSTLDPLNSLISSQNPMLGTDFAAGTSPTDFLVAYVPEPASAAMMLLIGAVPLMRRRR